MSEFISKPGKFRNYISSTSYHDSNTIKINLRDIVSSVLLSILIIFYHVKTTDLELSLKKNEEILLDYIRKYKYNEFFIGKSPPFLLQAFSIFNLTLGTLRMISLVSSFISIFLFFQILRLSQISTLISMIVTIMMSQLSIFQEELMTVSWDKFQILSILVTIFFWKLFKLSKSFSKLWFINLFLLSVTLGINMSIKFIGSMTLLWVLILSLIEIWRILGDIEIMPKKLFFHLLARFFLFSIPLIIFGISYYCQFSQFQENSKDLCLMSTKFQYLLNNSMELPPDYIYFGSTITLRHWESLGGYLHSHNYTYESGSKEQQVSLSNFPSEYNEWILESKHYNLHTQKKYIPLKNGDIIRLRHKLTGKLLRASSAKPPVSEQDYDQEISCTGDFNYSGDSDEAWSIWFENGYIGQKAQPILTKFKLVNVGQICTLLSHDVRLPRWAFEQQEVICINSPMESKTWLYIDSSSRYFHDKTLLFPDISPLMSFFYLLKEYLYKQFKYDYYLRNYGIIKDSNLVNWVIHTTGKTSNNFVWILGFISIVLYMITRMYAWIIWNPWVDNMNINIRASSLTHNDNMFEWVLGWILHYFIFIYSQHENLSIVQYYPSLIFATLQISTILQIISDKLPFSL